MIRGHGEITADRDLVIRLMRNERADYELMVRWLNTPHVKEWWDPDKPPHTYEQVVDEYRPLTMNSCTTTPCIVTVNHRDAGYVQFYPWTDDADYQRQLGMTLPESAWGIDILIGEERFLHKGYGRRTVALLCTYLVAERAATEVDLLTAQENVRAQSAYVAAGFTRVATYLDTDTRDGERILSWLMRWRP